MRSFLKPSLRVPLSSSAHMDELRARGRYRLKMARTFPFLLLLRKHHAASSAVASSTVGTPSRSRRKSASCSGVPLRRRSTAVARSRSSFPPHSALACLARICAVARARRFNGRHEEAAAAAEAAMEKRRARRGLGGKPRVPAASRWPPSPPPPPEQSPPPRAHPSQAAPCHVGSRTPAGLAWCCCSA